MDGGLHAIVIAIAAITDATAITAITEMAIDEAGATVRSIAKPIKAAITPVIKTVFIGTVVATTLEGGSARSLVSNSSDQEGDAMAPSQGLSFEAKSRDGDHRGFFC